MIKNAHITIFLVAMGLMSSSCAAQASQRFWQDSAGAWHKGANGAKAEPGAIADVTCGTGEAKIEITWYSDSGDWTAVDHYAAHSKPYFERQLTFAQFPIKVFVEKSTPDASTSIRFDGPSAMVDEFKNTVDLPPVVTFDRPEQFPFSLPSCARAAFSGATGVTT